MPKEGNWSCPLEKNRKVIEKERLIACVGGVKSTVCVNDVKIIPSISCTVLGLFNLQKGRWTSDEKQYPYLS